MFGKRKTESTVETYPMRLFSRCSEEDLCVRRCAREPKLVIKKIEDIDSGSQRHDGSPASNQ